MMVNFKLGEEMRNDVINMSRARDKKNWVPDRLYVISVDYELQQTPPNRSQ